MLIALKETYSFRSDGHHLAFHSWVRPSTLNYSAYIIVDGEKSASPEDEGFISLRLWFDSTGPSLLEELFLLALSVPRNLFQLPDCCTAGGLGAIVSRFLSSNLRSARLQRMRNSLNKEQTPVDEPPSTRAS